MVRPIFRIKFFFIVTMVGELKRCSKHPIEERDLIVIEPKFEQKSKKHKDEAFVEVSRVPLLPNSIKSIIFNADDTTKNMVPPCDDMMKTLDIVDDVDIPISDVVCEKTKPLQFHRMVVDSQVNSFAVPKFMK